MESLNSVLSKMDIEVIILDYECKYSLHLLLLSFQ